MLSKDLEGGGGREGRRKGGGEGEGKGRRKGGGEGKGRGGGVGGGGKPNKISL